MSYINLFALRASRKKKDRKSDPSDAKVPGGCIHAFFNLRMTRLPGGSTEKEFKRLILV
jgi:hypothetical protein